uniref:(California timema) hypothetical protein n=1 Tax=Timema californicum TaxID=61474 RepID=A0A7R9P7Y0_TIMCA|nr:unnamed protein product [Timema californicum]
MGINLNEFEIFGVSRKETKAIKTRHGESWLDSYAPQHTKDLAVHNKKVDELSAWMSSAVDNHSEFPMVLLITGPAGCGKTITLQVLAKNMNVNVREWVNPVTFTLDEERPSESFLSQAEEFRKFLVETGRMVGVSEREGTKKLVLVQELPNVFFSNPDKFHEILCEYCLICTTPLVFIFTDGITPSGNQLTSSLFPQPIVDLTLLTKISFNPIATTAMKKALKRIIQLASLDQNQQELDHLCEISRGDIRHAILTLQFSHGGAPPHHKDTKQRNVRSKKRSQTDSHTDTLTGPDILLGSLRNVGRVIYAKRDPVSRNFEHDPYEITSQFSSEARNFSSLLHENYINMFSNATDVMEATEEMSTADVVLSHPMAQELLSELGLSIAVAGIMMANKKPVRKWQPLTMSREHKLYLKTFERSLETKAVFKEHSRGMDTGQLMDYLGFEEFIKNNSHLNRSVTQHNSTSTGDLIANEDCDMFTIEDDDTF